jgi:hypothetical protein
MMMQQPGMYGYAQPHFIPGEILINGTCVSVSSIASFSLYISLTIHSQTDIRACSWWCASEFDARLEPVDHVESY